jgi:hypothetical protein
VAVVPFAVATVLVERFWGATSLGVFVVQTALLVPLALLGGWGVGLSGQERRRCLESLRALGLGGDATRRPSAGPD